MTESNGMATADRAILRELAAKVAAHAGEEPNAAKARLWLDHNGLRPTRAVVLASPEGGWRDCVPDTALRCAVGAARDWERQLRQTIFRAERIRDDAPITRNFNVGWVLHRGDYGVPVPHVRTEDLGSYHWDPPIKAPADTRKLRPREIRVDHEASQARLALAGEAVGDLLNVRLHGWPVWTVGLTWDLVLLRGLDQVMMDLYDEPGLIHELMAFLRDEKMRELGVYEREGVVPPNFGPDDGVGSGGLGHTDELPVGRDEAAGSREQAAGSSGCKPRKEDRSNARSPGEATENLRIGDIWGLSESQEFVGVGPDQFAEFVLPYQLPLINRFGLACYGCCEPLDRKFDLVLPAIPRLRRVSVSPWCNRALAAEKLGNRYVYSWKPNPAMVCAPKVDWALVEQSIRETLEITKGCRLEMILKDTHTFSGEADRPGRWAQIALRCAEGM
jgi:hypothetical protein